MKTFYMLLALAAAGICVAPAASARAGLSFNGRNLNGWSLNGTAHEGTVAGQGVQATSVILKDGTRVTLH